MPVVTVFEQHAQNYDEWFDEHESVYQAEIAALRKFVPVTGMGIEVGVGTGRFAVPLGVEFGLDPSRTMLQVARRRGRRVCQAVGGTDALSRSDPSEVSMKLPAAAYSAEVALRLRRPEAAGYLAKFSEATTLLCQGYGGFPSPSSP
ncbi:MAG: hypothetical protein AAB177_12220 [Nitrospirota bacterium]|jgi:SAM-dependent methyltransferase